MHPDTRLRCAERLDATGQAGMRRPDGQPLHLRLFGYPEATLGGRPLCFARRASLALLAYLALNRRPQRRATLADLVGDRVDDPQRQLRNVLADLASQLGDLLVVSSRAVALSERCAVRSDVADLEGALAAARAGGEPVALRQALDQCRSGFLDGLVLSASRAFDAWQAAERERLHTLVVQALERLCAHALQTGDTATGLTYTDRLLALEPWHEEAHRDRMLLLATCGQRSAALGQYEACRQVLAEEFGATPGSELRALYDRLRLAAAPPHNLAPEPARFIGRSRELALLGVMLDDPQRRLVTIGGPGGIGKSCLARHAVAAYATPEPCARWRRFPDGVWWVALDALEPRPCEREPEGAERIYAALAVALGLEPRSGGHDQQALLAHLHERRLLLVLDNHEHLPGADRAIGRLLAQTSHVTVLATTRLAVADGASLELGPMGLPAGAAALEDSDAGALFLSQARQMQARFAPTSADREAIVRICAATGGLPLALVHAAQQLRTLSCARIADRLERQGMAWLATALHNLPARHRSIAANLAYGQALNVASRRPGALAR